MDYRIKAAILALLIGGGIVLALSAELPDPASLRDQVAAAGAWGVVGFVAVYAGATLTPFPASALTIASGLLFGLAVGAAVVVFAATLGAWVAFLLARSLGRDGVSRIRWARIATIDAMLERRGLISVLLVRLVPLFPFMAVNYAAGLSAVRQRDYLLGTAVGIVPATVGYTALGAYGTSPLSWPFAAAVLAVVILTVVAGYAARRLKNSSAVDGDPLESGDDHTEGDPTDVRQLPA
ncbi:MAG: TVP38/TMEM64 family protein [Mycobacterium sp.]|nr:TVP38/TMEM64 family protein [Mycobacterium sp.]